MKNPTYGSHFRTIGGSGGKPPKSPKPPKNRPTPPPPFTVGTGGQPLPTAPRNWFIHQPEPWTPNFGNLPGYGVGPYEQQFTEWYTPPETLAGQLWAILIIGIDAHNGMPIPIQGQPGYIGAFEIGFSINPEDWEFGPPPSAPTGPGHFWNPFN
jgi:hypothetical protein